MKIKSLLKFLILLLGLVIALLMSACAAFQPSTMKDVYPAMYADQPLTVLVLPPVNNTTAADAREYFACSLSEALGMKGYYPLPVEAAFTVLRDEGMYDTENVTPAVLSNFRKYFGADAVLMTSIDRWDKSWFLTSGSLTITASYALVSTTTQEILWDFTTRTRVDLSSQNENLLFAIVESAVKTAVEDYFPHARKANILTFDKAMPYGRHHPEFNLDGDKLIDPNKTGDYSISK
jgi:hypothetical protein